MTIDPRHRGKLYGKYAGRVVDNADPTARGTITVVVPSVFGPELPVRARPCFPSGHFFVPPSEANVWVEFEAGDPNYPIWVGVWYPEGESPPEAQKDPPDSRVIQTVSGHTVEFNDTEDEAAVIVRHKDDSFIAIDKDGSVVIANRNGSTLVLDAAGESVSLVSEHGHTIGMNGDALVLMNKDGAALDLTGDTVRITAASIVLESTVVAVGKGAATGGEALVLQSAFDQLFQMYATHTHGHPMGPTLTPLPPPVPLPPALVATGAVVAK